MRLQKIEKKYALRKNGRMQYCMSNNSTKRWRWTFTIACLAIRFRNWTRFRWMEDLTWNLKTQILSLYAYRYPIKKVEKLHEPYESITTIKQIKRAITHARECGPGLPLKKSSSSPVRLYISRVDYFIDFINCPYFYRDAALGTRKSKLNSGQEILMSNVIRTVTRSTMISQYLLFCEEQVVPLSRATLTCFRSLRSGKPPSKGRYVVLTILQLRNPLVLKEFPK